MSNILNIMRSATKLLGICFAAFGFTCVADQITINFDDLPGTGGSIPAGYGSPGFQWQNASYIDAVMELHNLGPNGYFNGMVSSNNVLMNFNTAPTLVSSGLFDVNSAYITGVWCDGVEMDVKGFVHGTLIYESTFQVNSTGPTLAYLNIHGVDTVQFGASGGVDHGYPSTPNRGRGAGMFALDDLTVTIIPEPSLLALTSVGAAGLMISQRCKRHKSRKQ